MKACTINQGNKKKKPATEVPILRSPSIWSPSVSLYLGKHYSNFKLANAWIEHPCTTDASWGCPDNYRAFSALWIYNIITVDCEVPEKSVSLAGRYILEIDVFNSVSTFLVTNTLLTCSGVCARASWSGGHNTLYRNTDNVAGPKPRGERDHISKAVGPGHKWCPNVDWQRVLAPYRTFAETLR